MGQFEYLKNEKNETPVEIEPDLSLIR